MKKTLSVLLIFVFVFVFGACNNTETSTDNKNSEITISNNALSYSELSEYFSPSNKIFASYSDAVHNFEELEKTAMFVVRGYVLSTSQESGIAQKAVIKVIDTYKGKTATEIYLNQMLGDNIVENGNEYILFLNPQEPDNLNLEVYYPVGGGIGALKIDESAKEIFTSDDRIIDSDMKAWANNNLTSTRNGDEYKILVNPD